MKMLIFKQGLSTKVSFMYFIYISLPLVKMMYTCFDQTKKSSLLASFFFCSWRQQKINSCL